MEQLRNNKEFLKLCSDLKQKGIIKTKEEYFSLMINITRKHFKHNT